MNLREALQELVACKDLKERILELDNPPGSPELSVMFADYKSRQPLAWKAAREALAAPDESVNPLICYQQCALHRDIPYTFTVSSQAWSVVTVCPICYPPALPQTP